MSMTKISLEIDEDLNRRLKQYTLDKYGSTHGKQQSIIKTALIAYLSEPESKPVDAKYVDAAIEYTVEEPMPAAARTVIKPKKTKKARKTFKDDAEAVEKARSIWNSGERTSSRISKQVAGEFPQYTPRQVRYWITNNLKSK